MRQRGVAGLLETGLLPKKHTVARTLRSKVRESELSTS